MGRTVAGRRLRPWQLYVALLAASHMVQWVRPDEVPAAGVDTVEVAAQRADGAVADRRVRLAYRDVGNGDPLILLHGSPGSKDDFRRLVPMLAGRRALSLDLPGFGDSDRRVPDYGIEAHARYVLAFMDAVGIERADLFGFSMGSGVALHLQRLAPRRVRTISVYGGIGIQEGEGSGSYGFERVKYAAGYVALVVLPELVPHFGLLGRRESRHAFIRNFWDSDQRPLRGILESMRLPFLILHGRDDPLVPAWTAEQHHSIVRHSELVMFDAGHFMLFRDVGCREIAGELVPFLDRHRDDAAHPGRRTVDRSGGPAAPALPAALPLPERHGVAAMLLSLAGIGLVSEELGTLASAVLARHARLDFFLAVVAIWIAVLASDVGLWLTGRMLGPGASSGPDGWLERRPWRVACVVRLVPFARILLLVSGGARGVPAGRWLGRFSAVSIVSVPLRLLLAVSVADRLVTPLGALLRPGWFALGSLALAATVIVTAWTLRGSTKREPHP